MSSSTNNSSAFLDLKQIKKIEPKKPEKASNKIPNKNTTDNIKIDNLNAKTAEIMKTSPGMGNNFQNSLLHTNMNKSLINVNINNSNKIVKDDISNYEKNLFKGQPVNQTENKNENFNSHNMSNINNINNMNQNSSHNNSMIYNNQKRKYNQIMNNTQDYQNQNPNIDKNFQTPMPNVNLGASPLNQINKMRDINELIKTKKFKYY